MFRFTIRDVLWLMVVVGLASGWWMELTKVKALNRSMQVQIISLEWKRKYDHAAFNARELQIKQKAALDLSNAYADQRAIESRLRKTKALLHQQTVAAYKAMNTVTEIRYALDEHGLTTEEDDFGRVVSLRNKDIDVR